MDFQSINDIDMTTKEGKALFCALTILTVSPQLQIMGQTVNGRQVEPDVMLRLVESAAREIWPEKYSEQLQVLNPEMLTSGPFKEGRSIDLCDF